MTYRFTFLRPLALATCAAALCLLPVAARAAAGQTLYVNTTNPGLGVYGGPTYTVPAAGDAWTNV